MEVILITTTDIRLSDMKKMALPKITFEYDENCCGMRFHSDKEAT